MKKILTQLTAGGTLSKEEAKKVMLDIGHADFKPAELASFLTVFLMRPVTVDEFYGFREALLEMSLPVDLGTTEAIDIVGTGGDGKNTFNISTVSCFVVAGAGYKVIKHGNYASSSVSGSSNVLEMLGYRFSNEPALLKKQLEEANLTFLHAPLFHPALKSVAPVRRELGLRTIFNMLGPVVNPARPKHQLLGVYHADAGKLYSAMLTKAGVNHTIVHSTDGYDEISLTADFDLFINGEHQTVSPEEIGFDRVKPEAIYGGDTIQKAAKIFTDVLEGKASPAQTNVVLANSAYAIMTISGKSYEESLQRAKDSLLGGKALKTFKKLIG
jgi:anthranilate phosphoribosyltransferase